MDFIVDWFIEFIILSLFVFLSYYFSRPSAGKSIGNEKVVSYGWFMKIIAIVALFFGIAFYVYEINFNGISENDPDEFLPLIFATTIFIVLGLIIFLETFKSRVFFSEDGIRKESVWTRDHMIRWNQIESLSHSENLNMVIIKSSDGPKIRVIEYMNGFEELMSEIKERSLG